MSSIASVRGRSAPRRPDRSLCVRARSAHPGPRLARRRRIFPAYGGRRRAATPSNCADRSICSVRDCPCMRLIRTAPCRVSRRSLGCIQDPSYSSSVSSSTRPEKVRVSVVDVHGWLLARAGSITVTTQCTQPIRACARTTNGFMRSIYRVLFTHRETPVRPYGLPYGMWGPPVDEARAGKSQCNLVRGSGRRTLYRARGRSSAFR